MAYPYYPQNYMQNYPQSYPQIAQTPQPTSDMNWVQGEAGAKGYHISPNTTVTLWDSEAQTIYVKSANAVGVPTITILDYEIRNQKPLNEPQTGFATQDEVDMLCDELDKIASKGELTAGSLDTVQKLTHSLKSIETIMAMENASYDDGYYRGYERSGRGRDSMGRYTRSYARNGRSRRMYSGDMEEKITELMDETDDPKIRQALQKALDKMEG